jgi:translation initiation factor 4A
MEDINIYNEFDDMNLKDNLLRGIYSYGYEKPSAIQQKAIIPCIEGKDIIAQAQSGTGKTATFTIGLLQRLEEKDKTTQVIILSHTRELSIQIHEVVSNISKFMDVSINLSVGGIDIKDNINSLTEKPHIIIGTPGRILDMIQRRYIDIEKIKLIVIDEADELLSNIFISQIKDIFQYLPPKMQVCLFSATMNDHFFEITHKFMCDPIKILIKNNELTLEGIKQYYVNVERNDYKYDTLIDLYSSFSMCQSIIYCNSRRMVDILSDKLNKEGFSISFIHSGLSQTERNKRIKEFRDGESRILISTDLLARGIDIQQISLVINYDIPKEKENYIHRIGRSGRYGRKGVALNFATNYDIDKIKDIEKYYSTHIEVLPSPEVLTN